MKILAVVVEDGLYRLKMIKIEQGRENQVLRTVSKPVGKITKELRHFALDMIKFMNAENGVGLASPQAGRNIRMIVCKFNHGTKNELIMVMINPQILEKSPICESGEEGCLSLPDEWGFVERSKVTLVRFTDLKGAQKTMEFSDFNARIIQHEIDHLDGILFVDRASEMIPAKNAKRAKSNKAQKEEDYAL